MYKNTRKEDLIKLLTELNISLSEPTTVLNLKNQLESSAIFKSEPDFVKDTLNTIVEDRVSQVQLQQLENSTLKSSTDTVSELSHCTVESLLHSVKALALPVPTKAENFHLFFQTLERAFQLKNVPPAFKSEILLNLLGEKAHNILLYIGNEELQDYVKLKEIVLREFQPTPYECLNNFRQAKRYPSETHIQFISRLSSLFDYYLLLRKVSDFQSLRELIIADTFCDKLDRDTAYHIRISQGNNWFKPLELSTACDIYHVSKNKPFHDFPHEVRVPTGQVQRSDKRSLRYEESDKARHTPFKYNTPKHNCYVCGSSTHFAKNCYKRFQSQSNIKPANLRQETQLEENKVTSCRIIQNSANVHKLNKYDFMSKLEYINVCIEGTTVKQALLDSGCVFPIINSKYIFSEIIPEDSITLTSCFGEKQEAQLARFKVSLNNSPPIEILAAITYTLDAECILPPKVYEMLQNAHPPQMLEKPENTCVTNISTSSETELPENISQCLQTYPNFLLNISNLVDTTESIDLSYISDLKLRREISELVYNYKPLHSKSTN